MEMELTKLCKKHFNCSNLYDVFGIDKSTDRTTVTKAFLKLSLKCHPFESSIEDTDMCEKFNTLFKVYSVLSDKGRKQVYDETGCVWLDEQLIANNFDWIGHWVLVFTDFVKETKISYQRLKEDDNNLALENLPTLLSITLNGTAEDESRIQSILSLMNDIPRFKEFIPNAMKQVASTSSIKSVKRKILESSNQSSNGKPKNKVFCVDDGASWNLDSYTNGLDSPNDASESSEVTEQDRIPNKKKKNNLKKANNVVFVGPSNKSLFHVQKYGCGGVGNKVVSKYFSEP